MGKVGGKVKVANLGDFVIIQEQNGEVSTHGEIPLKMYFKENSTKQTV